MSCPDFNWNDDRIIVVQREQRELAVYSNPHGQAVIRARANWDEDDDPFIVIDRSCAVDLARAVLEAAGIPATVVAQKPPSLLTFPAPDPAPKDPTAAERQRRHRNRRNAVTVDRDGNGGVTVSSRDGDRNGARG